MKIIKVRWIDSATHTGWCGIRRKFEPSDIESIGYVVSETPTSLTLTSSVGDGDGVLDAITIPKRAIITRRYVK